jgi:hypothetical protein
LVEKPSQFRLDESTNRMKTRAQLFYHISYRLHWFGVVLAEYTARVLNSTFNWLSRQDKDHIFLQVWAQEAHMVIMSRAFVFLNCDIGAERAIIGNVGHHLRLSNHGGAELMRLILATML